MSVLLTTTGTPATVTIADFGARAFVHPVVDLDLLLEFTAEELRDSTDLQAAVDAAQITLTDASGNPITSVASIGGHITFRANAVSEVTTTLDTDTVIPGMTITPGAGTYLAEFASAAAVNKNARTVFVSLYVNGVQVALTEREAGGQSNNVGGIVFTAEVTVADAQAIDVRWRVNNTAGGPVATMNARELSLVDKAS